MLHVEFIKIQNGRLLIIFVCPQGETGRMGSTRKLWLLVLLGGCILMLQYHVSTTWSAPGPAGPSNAEGLVQAAVSRLQLDTSMAHTIGELSPLQERIKIIDICRWKSTNCGC